MTRIILLSYGMRRHTKSAVAQARRFGHPIHLVPAIPSAMRGLRTHRSSLVTVHDEVGRAGLLAALDGEAGEVLLIHEDVLLHPDAAARLLEVAAAIELVAVPRTNHTDVDGATGDLPGDVVQPLGERSEPTHTERARTVCLAAPASRIRALVSHRLTAASTRIFFPNKSAVLVAEAVATHLDDGPDQLEAPTGPEGRPLLVASMIVRDEEMFLEGCLASLDGLVDRIDVCDTGSTDRTVEIAEAAGAKVTTVEWRNDFAWARNQALEMSRDAWWVLQIDADERARVEDPEAFRSFLATALADGEGFDVPLRDVAADGTELGGQQLPRIFRGATTSFHGRVHEVAQHEDGSMISWAVTTELEIEHHGYRPEVIAARDKHARNLALAREDHAEEPNAISRLQLARSLPFGDEKLALLEKLYADVAAGDGALNEAGQVPVYQMLAHALVGVNRGEEAWDVISEGRRLFPHVPAIRATFAELGTKLEHHEDVVRAATTTATGDGARPWSDTLSDLIALIETSKAQIATDDLAGASSTLRRLLERQIPTTMNRWREIASLVAVTMPDEALDLLLPHAARDETGDCLREVTGLLDPSDAAEYVVLVLSATKAPSPSQKSAAWERIITADEPESLEALAAAIGAGASEVAAALPAAGPRLLRHLQARGSHDIADLGAIQDQVDALVADITGDRPVDTVSAGALIASDTTGVSLQRLSRDVPAARAAPVAAAAVAAGATDAASVQLALVLCTVADDAAAAESMRGAATLLSPDQLALLRQRAAARGATQMAAFLASLM